MPAITDATSHLSPSAESTSQRSVNPRSLSHGAILFTTLAVSAFIPVTVSAQPAGSTHQPGHRVAVIDVAYIFKNLPSIKEQVDTIKRELEKHDAEIKQKQENLKQAAAKLKTLKIGTPDYDRQEENVANLESKLRLEMNRKRKELGGAEAKIYFDNYRQIRAAVAAIASHNNIKLVLRFNGEDMDLNKSESVARGVMKLVVYHDTTIDITRTVMQYLEQDSNASQVATRPDVDSGTNR